MKYAFARKFDVSPVRGVGASNAQSGAGGEGDYGNPSCVWDQSSTAMKALMIGGGLVALGSVGLAFLGPAKLMTTYLIASAIGATTGLGTYYYQASQATCDDVIDPTGNPTEAMCQAALANLTPAEKATWQMLEAATKAAIATNQKTIVLEGKTYTIDQAWKTYASKFEASGSPAAKQFANCLRMELENPASV